MLAATSTQGTQAQVSAGQGSEAMISLNVAEGRMTAAVAAESGR